MSLSFVQVLEPNKNGCRLVAGEIVRDLEKELSFKY